jgi:hypothetical protein
MSNELETLALYVCPGIWTMLAEGARKHGVGSMAEGRHLGRQKGDVVQALNQKCFEH